MGEGAFNLVQVEGALYSRGETIVLSVVSMQKM